MVLSLVSCVAQPRQASNAAESQFAPHGIASTKRWQSANSLQLDNRTSKCGRSSGCANQTARQNSSLTLPATTFTAPLLINAKYLGDPTSFAIAVS
jgi:hypothetical protein